MTAVLVLVVTGLAKIWTFFGTAKVLAVPDPIFGIQFRYLMLVAAAFELVVVGVCFVKKSEILSLALIAWLSTSFAVYRVGLWLMDWQRPCGCLGNLTDALNLSSDSVDMISRSLLVYLLAGSVGLLITRMKMRLSPVRVV